MAQGVGCVGLGSRQFIWLGAANEQQCKTHTDSTSSADDETIDRQAGREGGKAKGGGGGRDPGVKKLQGEARERNVLGLGLPLGLPLNP